jgi:ubiquinol-cytochrome c reductase cytochrome c1 subunit
MLRSILKPTSAAIAAAASVATASVAFSSDDALHPPSYPWPHHGALSSFDAKSIRRGHIVYKQVCASCHSLERISFRDLVGVCYTEDQVKRMAADVDVVDGPNDTGAMFDRPGKLSDPLPRPYANEQAARAANGGALPPDLSLITKARDFGENYIFALLAGYRSPPEGVVVREGLYYNPYFPGGAIAMPPPLLEGAVDFPDGTPATVSQMAKDVVTFLAWAAEPEHDERKELGFRTMLALGVMACFTIYFKRLRWAPIKNRRITFRD